MVELTSGLSRSSSPRPPAVGDDVVMAPARAARQRLSASQRREQILAAAFAEFAAHGYHAAATADIARRAGISQPYIYALFPDKKALFLACHERAMQRLRNLLVEAAGSRVSPSTTFARIEHAFRD